MSLAFPVSYVIGRRQITKSKVDRWLVFYLQNYMKRNNLSSLMLVCTTVFYEYMKSLRNGVNNLFGNTHMRIKIYQKFYHNSIYIANEGCHVNGKGTCRYTFYIVQCDTLCTYPCRNISSIQAYERICGIHIWHSPWPDSVISMKINKMLVIFPHCI